MNISNKAIVDSQLETYIGFIPLSEEQREILRRILNEEENTQAVLDGATGVFCSVQDRQSEDYSRVYWRTFQAMNTDTQLAA